MGDYGGTSGKPASAAYISHLGGWLGDRGPNLAGWIGDRGPSMAGLPHHTASLPDRHLTLGGRGTREREGVLCNSAPDLKGGCMAQEGWSHKSVSEWYTIREVKVWRWC